MVIGHPGARMDDPYRETASPATLSPNKKHCYACANILDVRAELCPRCGVRQPFVPGVPFVASDGLLFGRSLLIHSP